MSIDTRKAAENRNVQALLDVIMMGESGGDYSILYGGGHFTDYSRHPNIRVPFHNPRKPAKPDGTPNDYSTAAGAFQINYPTEQVLQAAAALEGLTLTDFSPQQQVLRAVLLLKLNGALSLILRGHFNEALYEASGGDNGLLGWASLPGSNSGQRQLSLASATQVYINGGGVIA